MLEALGIHTQGRVQELEGRGTTAQRAWAGKRWLALQFLCDQVESGHIGRGSEVS